MLLYHILNGDCLKEQLEGLIEGEIIICRECLVDGDVSEERIEDFFKTRASFILKSFDSASEDDYYKKVVKEFQKINTIPTGAEVNLWFEDDLFCQVNLWFVASLLVQTDKEFEVYLVRPLESHPYSFGHHSSSALQTVYDNKIRVTHLNDLAALWSYYKSDDSAALIEHAEVLISQPHILRAVQAHLDRQPTAHSVGRPQETLINIIEQYGKDDFGIIFREFTAREGIYGFGDLQLRKLIEELEEEDP